MTDFVFNEISLNELGFHVNPNYTISSPTPKISYIDVPYSNGELDMTEALIDNVVYNDRDISLMVEKFRPKEEWGKLYSTLLNELNGRKFKIKVPYENDYYFEGRVTVGNMNRGTMMTVPISVKCFPYMLKNEITTIELTVNGTHNIKLENDMMPANIVLTNSNEVTIRYQQMSITVPSGRNILPILLDKGETEIQVSAIKSTNIKIEYQEGRL